MAMAKTYSEAVDSLNSKATGWLAPGAQAKMPEGPYASAKPPETEIDIVNRALSQSRELAHNIKSIVNIICGSVPESGQSLNGVGICDGILPNLASSARDSIDAMSEAESALRRLNERLS